MKALFLYTELADYFLKCCEALSEHCEVHIVRRPVNAEAPFKFSFQDTVRVYERNATNRESLKALAGEIRPDIIFCSGWVDKDYLTVISSFSGTIPTVMLCDTRWNGSVKQWIGAIAGRIYLSRIFSHAWVPGESQARYMWRMGFRNVRRGFYCCDLKRFNAIRDQTIAGKEQQMPKRFIYSGRYYAFKGVEDLWQAFASFRASGFDDWELWCLGTGDIQPPELPGIKHLGFVQPDELAGILRDCGVFVLPSRFEPWGVVVQEFAAAGFPLLLSDAVGAGEKFLVNGENGFSFPAFSPGNLASSMKNIASLSHNELLLMGRKSHALAQEINQRQWVETVAGIVSEFRKN